MTLPVDMLRAIQVKWYIFSVVGGEESWIKADREREREVTEQWEKWMEGGAEIEEEREREKRVGFVKRGDFSHVIADSAPQLGCTRIYYFTRAWKTQQIKLWSCCLLEMDIFILDFRFSSLKSTFEILSYQTVAGVHGYRNLWIHFCGWCSWLWPPFRWKAP